MMIKDKQGQQTPHKYMKKKKKKKERDTTKGTLLVPQARLFTIPWPSLYNSIKPMRDC